ncbi:hypothetical protein C2G38_791421 [Gigaspora rosea]|uniref:Uncharacterized protein n=1 Tax=Gigaspora rosea TaxID=44941 RepID=A0A397VPS6_9GLOM|nr:hypothetical protein C2G38_791421 [Gigaspora rosea]
MEVPDKFGDSRKEEYGKCKSCNYDNTSPAWCQSCDLWKTALGWTSKNEELDKLIKEYQIDAMKYEGVIEWIPSNKLIDIKEMKKEYKPIKLQKIQETKEESNQIFTATLKDDIQTIKEKSGKYEQLRIEAHVNLMKLQANTLDLLEKVNAIVILILQVATILLM